MNSTIAYVFCLKGTSKLQHRGGTQMEPSNLTELRNQRLELGEAEMASIWGTKYPREGSIRVCLSLWLNTNLCMCRMKNSWGIPGKEQLRGSCKKNNSQNSRDGEFIPVRVERSQWIQQHSRQITKGPHLRCVAKLTLE